jgi:phosphoribosylamine-glycine ligase
MADGKQVEDFKYNEGYCIVSWLYTKPFPSIKLELLKKEAEKIYGGKMKDDALVEGMSYKMSDSMGMPVLFKEKLTKEDLDNIHFDAVMLEGGQLKIANSDGYVVTVTGMGKTVDDAAEKVDTLLKKIVVPGGFYRNDFTKSNYHKSRNDLIDWGFLNEEKDVDELTIIKNQLKEVLKK